MLPGLPKYYKFSFTFREILLAFNQLTKLLTNSLRNAEVQIYTTRIKVDHGQSPEELRE